MMVSIQQATENAMAFAREALGSTRTAGLRLEEVESKTVEGEDAWLITLSMMSLTEDGPSTLGAALGAMAKRKREYKSFTVHKRDGEIISMKIRELADV
jgi:hypothetical protein